MAKPAVILVGADKGGVGKTTVSRTLVDYFTAHQVPIRAFDTEAPKGTLKRFHPDLTDVVDITKVPDQMKIFDTLNSAEATVTLIDVRAGLMSPTLQALQRHRLHRGGQEGPDHLRGVPHPRARPSPRSTRSRTPPPISATRATSWSRTSSTTARTSSNGTRRTHKAYFNRIKDAVEITIPKLNEMATEQVDLASVPYLTFIANKKPGGEAASYSFVLRGYVRHWLGNVWAEYDRIKLTDLVGAKPQDRRDRAAAGSAEDPGRQLETILRLA